MSVSRIVSVRTYSARPFIKIPVQYEYIHKYHEKRVLHIESLLGLDNCFHQLIDDEEMYLFSNQYHCGYDDISDDFISGSISEFKIKHANQINKLESLLSISISVSFGMLYEIN